MKACSWWASSLSCYKNYIFNTAKMFRYELLTTAAYNQPPEKCVILNTCDKEVKFYFSEYSYLVHGDLSVTYYLIYGLHTLSCVWNGTLCTRSPFVPHLAWLAPCSRWKFLRDTGGVHQIHTWYSLFVWGSSDPHIVFTICLCIYLYLRCKVCSFLFNQIKIMF
jgi:hypothetical protein